MNRKLMLSLSLLLGLLMTASGARAQVPDDEGAPPPLPGGGRFVFMRGEFSFENRLKPITGAPFSAQASTVTTQVLGDGNQIKHTESGEVYRDSSGRTRREMTIDHIGPWSAASTPRKIVHISDPVAGATYLLDVTDKTVVKGPEHGPSGAWLGPESRKLLAAERGGNSSAQRTTESLGSQVMAGITVQGTRTTETIPAGAVGNQNPLVIVSERWTSPDLQTVVYSKHTDPRFGTTIYQLTNINRQEPDPTLFQIPADYTAKEGRAVRVHPRE